MLVNNKKKSVGWGIIILLCTIGLMIIKKISNYSLNRLVIYTFFLNGILWIYLFHKEIKKRAYSMAMMHWLFCIFFFCFAPTVQYFYNRFPWILERSDDILIRANLFLLCWTLAVVIGSKVVKQKKKVIVVKRKINFFPLLPVLTFINIGNMIVRIKSIGIENMFSRATNSDVSFSTYGSLSMMISGSLQAAAYFAVVLSILKFRTKHKGIGYLLINGGGILVSYFPTSLARYATAVIYLGLFLMTYRNAKKNRVFIFLFIVAFIVILPALNVFRTTSFNEVNLMKTLKDILTNLVDTWKKFDYDAYTIFTLAIDNVDMYGTGGTHILSILLFWVPRAIWTTKPLSGSYEMAHDRGLAFDNLSCPLPAEGMLDGGIIGVFILGIAIGYIMHKIDSFYWNYTDCVENEIDSFDLIYPVIVIFWFFMCRGDMFYTIGFLVAYIIVWKIITCKMFIRHQGYSMQIQKLY